MGILAIFLAQSLIYIKYNEVYRLILKKLLISTLEENPSETMGILGYKNRSC
jgi:hypothetical protein